MKYRLIYADPPWHYNDRKAIRKDNPNKAPRFGIGAHGNYSAGTMTNQELADMAPLVQAVCEPDAYLFMWATGPRLDSALAIGDAWGFVFVTIAFCWVKTTKTGVPFFGTGAYTGSNVEPVLLFRRQGSKKCWHPNGGGHYKPAQVLLTPHPTDAAGKIIHSRKPQHIRSRLEMWLGEIPRLELFATERSPGWTALGHALTGTDIRDNLAALADHNSPKEICHA